MKKKKKGILFWIVLISLFVVFCGLYVAMGSGYYETKMNQEALMTKEKIVEFERDVKEGKEIDINNYLDKSKEEYNNKVSKAGIDFSSGVEKIMTRGIASTLKVLSKLFGS